MIPSAPPAPMTARQLLAARAKPEAPAPIATLSEVFSESAPDGAATGFVLSHLKAKPGPVLWVQDRLTAREAGRPYTPGLAPDLRLILVSVNRPVDVLWAMEQGLGCTALGAVVGEVHGNHKALDFTASKRLAMRSEAHRVPAWLIRRGARADLSAARQRWRLASRPSAPAAFDARAPGPAEWQAELFRARHRPPGDWRVRLDASTEEVQFRETVPLPEAHRRPALQAVG